MEPVTIIEGDVSVLDRDDVDTDQIIPKQFLKRVERTGFGEFLFYDWAKEPGWDLPPNPILVAGENFGCGSSREHAPWALLDYGIHAVLCSEIADIFRNNALKNGLLAIVLDEAEHRWLLANPGIELTIDVREQVIALPDGGHIRFQLEPFARHCLLNGVDQLGYLLQHNDLIDAFVREREGQEAAIHGRTPQQDQPRSAGVTL